MEILKLKDCKFSTSNSLIIRIKIHYRIENCTIFFFGEALTSNRISVVHYPLCERIIKCAQCANIYSNTVTHIHKHARATDKLFECFFPLRSISSLMRSTDQQQQQQDVRFFVCLLLWFARIYTLFYSVFHILLLFCFFAWLCFLFYILM